MGGPHPNVIHFRYIRKTYMWKVYRKFTQYIDLCGAIKKTLQQRGPASGTLR